MLASLVALRKAMQKYPIRHAVSFHSSIARAYAFKEFNDVFTEFHTKSEQLDTFHVTGAMASAVRKQMLKDFSRTNRALITNARCLTEGVDVPNIDCVLFADPKQSTIDIVQAVGRALRPSIGKKFGYILVPVISRGNDAEAFTNSPAFLSVMTVLRALASNDERIIEYFRAIHNGRRVTGKVVEIELDEKIGKNIDLQKFVEQIETRVWSRLARLAWRTYDESVSFVHELQLKSQNEWMRYSKGLIQTLPKRPLDVPAAPHRTYRGEFQQRGGWGSWLGTGRKGTHVGNFRLRSDRHWRSYNEAAKFVRTLDLRNTKEWAAYCKGKMIGRPPKPDDIPSTPDHVYKTIFTENGGMPGWLGNKDLIERRKIKNYRSYDDSLTFVHTLNLRSSRDWFAYCKNQYAKLPRKPIDIPVYPNKIYKDLFKNRGGWGAWIGTNRRSHGAIKWLSYDDARRFVSSLNLKSFTQWKEYARGKRADLPKKPENIPASPETVYRTEFLGRGGYGYWLGTGHVATTHKNIDWRTYSDARDFVHTLGLSKMLEWRAYCWGKRLDLPVKPLDIPNSPDTVYGQEFRSNGGWPAWLGTE